MIGWIFLIGFFATIFIFFYHTGTHLEEIKENADYFDSHDLGIYLFIGSLLCIIWPITLPGAILFKIGRARSNTASKSK